MSRSKSILSILLMGILILCLYLGRQGEGLPVEDEPAHRRLGPHTTSTTLTGMGSPEEGNEGCTDTQLAANALALQVYETCEETFAVQALCTPPVPFPSEYSPEQQALSIEEAFTGCDLSTEELVIDCSEFPCVAIVSADTVRKKQLNCAYLADMAREMAEGSSPGMQVLPPAPAAPVGDVDAQDSTALSGWVFDVPDVSSDPSLYTAMKARIPARQQGFTRRLDGATSASASALARMECDLAKQALGGLAGVDPCSAVREYWGCIDDSVIDAGTYLRYVAHAEAVFDELLEDCPNVTPENTLIDCSGLPCLILVEAPGLSRTEAFCQHEDLFSFTGTGWHRDLKIAELYPSMGSDDEAEVRARFDEYEREPRVWRVIDDWLSK